MLRALIIAAAVLAGTPVLAQDITTRRQTVSYADLNLAGAAGREVLARRIHRAVDRVCGTYSEGVVPAVNADLRRCRSEAAGAALARMDEAVRAAVAPTVVAIR